MTGGVYITIAAGEAPIAGVSPIVYEIRRSRFLAYVRRAEDEAEVRAWLGEIRKKHFDARHMPYAFVCGASAAQQRSRDDGEPASGSVYLAEVGVRGLEPLAFAG